MSIFHRACQSTFSFWIIVALAATLAPSLSAQSLFAGRGLGFVAEPLDARARGLGGVGLGLPEANLSLVNPAGVAAVPASALQVTLQPDWLTATYGNLDATGTAVRFPLIHAALPFQQRWTFSVGFGSFLDQNWAVEQQDTLMIGNQRVPVVDRFVSRGGVARLRLGSAYNFGPRFAVGVAADLYTGAAQDTAVRIFEDVGLQPAFFPSVWTYSGVGYAAGASWVPTEALAFGAAVSVGGTLQAQPQDTLGAVMRYSLPTTASLGASAQITPTTLVALSGRWSGWSAAANDLAAVGGAEDSWAVSGGIEWDALQIANQAFPLRIGGRYATLPFAADGAVANGTQTTERVLSAGAGARLAAGAARADLALERGERGGVDAGISESFWRLVVSLTVLGR